jgi:hypothetical protein
MTSALIIFSMHKVNNYVCKKHVLAEFRKWQTHNLFLGWWSVYGIIFTPAYLVGNTNELRHYYQTYNSLVTKLNG